MQGLQILSLKQPDDIYCQVPGPWNHGCDFVVNSANVAQNQGQYVNKWVWLVQWNYKKQSVGHIWPEGHSLLTPKLSIKEGKEDKEGTSLGSSLSDLEQTIYQEETRIKKKKKIPALTTTQGVVLRMKQDIMYTKALWKFWNSLQI